MSKLALFHVKHGKFCFSCPCCSSIAVSRLRYRRILPNPAAAAAPSPRHTHHTSHIRSVEPQCICRTSAALQNYCGFTRAAGPNRTALCSAPVLAAANTRRTTLQCTLAARLGPLAPPASAAPPASPARLASPPARHSSARRTPSPTPQQQAPVSGRAAGTQSTYRLVGKPAVS